MNAIGFAPGPSEESELDRLREACKRLNFALRAIKDAQGCLTQMNLGQPASVSTMRSGRLEKRRKCWRRLARRRLKYRLNAGALNLPISFRHDYRIGKINMRRFELLQQVAEIRVAAVVGPARRGRVDLRVLHATICAVGQQELNHRSMPVHRCVM